ncbi:MAG TPA: hypothetical protein VLF93_05820 [Candidatus Saccharimonadales bacterium]|nr:hypothetical protein [Candidatus Saccharimonadales bacterium]
MKRLALALAALIELLTLEMWFVCVNFSDIFHFKAINITYQVDTSINPFTGHLLKVAHVFHNKFIQIPIDVLRIYLQFWDVRFGTNWFSLVGYFGIFAGFYYLISHKKKTIYHWLALAMLLVLPFIEIIVDPDVSFLVKCIYLWLPYSAFSLYGIYQFLIHGNRKKRLILVAILLVASWWWFFILPHNMENYCMRPTLLKDLHR